MSPFRIPVPKPDGIYVETWTLDTESRAYHHTFTKVDAVRVTRVLDGMAETLWVEMDRCPPSPH